MTEPDPRRESPDGSFISRGLTLPVSLARDPRSLAATIEAGRTDLESGMFDPDGQAVVPGSARVEAIHAVSDAVELDGSGGRAEPWSEGQDVPTWATGIAVHLIARTQNARPLADVPITIDVKDRDQ